MITATIALSIGLLALCAVGFAVGARIAPRHHAKVYSEREIHHMSDPYEEGWRPDMGLCSASCCATANRRSDLRHSGYFSSVLARTVSDASTVSDRLDRTLFTARPAELDPSWSVEELAKIATPLYQEHDVYEIRTLRVRGQDVVYEIRTLRVRGQDEPLVTRTRKRG